MTKETKLLKDFYAVDTNSGTMAWTREKNSLREWHESRDAAIAAYREYKTANPEKEVKPYIYRVDDVTGTVYCVAGLIDDKVKQWYTTRQAAILAYLPNKPTATPKFYRYDGASNKLMTGATHWIKGRYLLDPMYLSMIGRDRYSIDRQYWFDSESDALAHYLPRRKEAKKRFKKIRTGLNDFMLSHDFSMCSAMFGDSSSMYIDCQYLEIDDDCGYKFYYSFDDDCFVYPQFD